MNIRVLLCRSAWTVAATLFLVPLLQAQLAFPGAEGFAAGTPGGRGGAVLRVTNLNDSGPGSLREACEASGPRIVVFTVGGTIELKSTIKITSPYLTIAGQSAPGGGICLKSSGSTTLAVKTHDVVLRYLRIRPGPGGESDGLALQTEDAHDIMIDHCSITWGVDESASIYTGSKNKIVNNVTYQWCIISDALDCSTHEEGCHSKGLLLQYCDRISLHHNLFANNGGRNPMILSGKIDAVNNVVYNWGGSAVKIENRHGDVFLNYINNYLVPGRDSDLSENGIQVKTAGIYLYLAGNIAEHVRPNDTYPEDAIVNYRVAGEPLAASRFAYPTVTTTTAAVAYDEVLDGSGATLPARDAADRHTVAGVRDRTGRIIDDPAEVGGYPLLATGTAPVDTDADGMPDEWETAHGLDAADPSDARRDADGDGYTNIEAYLNALVDGGGSDPTPDDRAGGTFQAEEVLLSGGMEVTDEHAGYRASGFVNFPRQGGSVEFRDIDGGDGGLFQLTLRYALGKPARTGLLSVNGAPPRDITVASTGSWTSWATHTTEVTLAAGSNTLRLQSSGSDFGNLDEIVLTPVAAAATAALSRATTPAAPRPLIGGPYPNPTDGIITLQLREPAWVSVRSIDGRTVYGASLGQGKHRVDLTGQPAGVYLVDDGGSVVRVVVR